MQWEMIKLALQRISGDRRMVCVIAPVIIGFLPSAGAVNICGANAMIVLLIPLAFVIILTGYYMILSGFGI